MRAPGTSHRLWNAVIVAASAWALANTLYVYLLRDGRHEFRVETAALLLIAVSLPRLLRRPAVPPAAQPAMDARVGPIVIAVAFAMWLPPATSLVTLPFLSDDYVFAEIYRPPHPLTVHGEFFRPLFGALFWVVLRLCGPSAVAFHLIALVLHTASAWLVFRLSRRLVGFALACLTCAVFLVNPLQLEAVAWASGLQEILWTLFTLAALDVYTARRELTAGRAAATLALMAAALVSKETAVCGVALLAGADWLVFSARRGRLLVAMWLALAAQLLAYLALRASVVPLDTQHVSVSRYIVKQFLVTPYRVFIQPWNETLHVPLAVPLIVSVCAVAMFTAYVLRATASRMILIGPAVMLLTTLPVYGFFFVGADLAAARYVYFASAGWGLLIACLVAGSLRGSRWMAVAALSIVLAYGAALRANARAWHTAGDFVSALASGVVHGENPERSLETWRRRTGVRPAMRNGVPVSVQGVAVFVNGYEEFVRANTPDHAHANPR